MLNGFFLFGVGISKRATLGPFHRAWSTRQSSQTPRAMTMTTVAIVNQAAESHELSRKMLGVYGKDIGGMGSQGRRCVATRDFVDAHHQITTRR
jgi:hypothetical protein